MRAKRSFGAAEAWAADSDSAAKVMAVTRNMRGTIACRAPDSLGRVPETPPEPLWASSLKAQPRHVDPPGPGGGEPREKPAPPPPRPAEAEPEAPPRDAPFAL